jgi:hypothetical protein
LVSAKAELVASKAVMAIEQTNVFLNILLSHGFFSSFGLRLMERC